MSQIRDISLASQGEQRIQWARAHMPLLARLEEEFSRTRPFEGRKISVSVHLEAKTARLCRLLAAGGAQVAVTGSNPLSPRADICAALAASGMEVYAWYGASPEEYTAHLKAALSFGPDIIIDDGGDFLSLLHGELSHLSEGILGGCEETTTGVLRMRAREREGSLKFPMFAVNDGECKHLFDNRFGTGQSVWDAVMRLTNLVIAGKNVVVAGFGHCGQGVAEKARGLGARVIVTEVNPVRAIEAAMQGYLVMPMEEAAQIGDIFVTVTGCCNVITGKHFMLMKEGALLANAGHFDVEVDVATLRDIAVREELLRKDIVGYTLPNGKTVCLLAEGRLVNIAGGDGHPAEIMDMSFALQALCALYVNQHASELKPAVYDVPRDVDLSVARMKLSTLGLSIDALSREQEQYLAGTGE